MKRNDVFKSMISQIISLQPSDPAPSVEDVTASKLASRIALYEPIMKGNDHFTLNQIVDVIGESKISRSTVNTAMRTVLVPLGYVERIPTRTGKNTTIEYKWINR